MLDADEFQSTYAFLQDIFGICQRARVSSNVPITAIDAAFHIAEEVELWARGLTGKLPVTTDPK
jgi:hypothetical protein